MSTTDDKIMQMLGTGARTHHIAKKMGWDTPRANRALRRLEKDGRVKRDARHSAVNDIRWLPGDAA
ncbi:hypothetical protein [uncultured Novosphingobium sp.]|uniref:hypothetical protein n=1 Tax=uncultured Novosphingobium sp. TaxID=292277 RepID=UPI00374799B3